MLALAVLSGCGGGGGSAEEPELPGPDEARDVVQSRLDETRDAVAPEFSEEAGAEPVDCDANGVPGRSWLLPEYVATDVDSAALVEQVETLWTEQALDPETTDEVDFVAVVAELEQGRLELLVGADGQGAVLRGETECYPADGTDEPAS